MDHGDVERLRDRHPAWRLLRAGNAPLVLTFLGQFFVEDNNGAASVSVLAAALDDELYALNATEPDAPCYPKSATDYLEDWSQTDAGWLRRFYPLGSDEVHYDATPAFEKAYAWVCGLKARPFVGTESRLHTVVELLRQIVHGTETDPRARLVELLRRRDAINREIAEVEAGNLTLLSATALRDRYQQFAVTARDLLSDFREVEENFRGLDRAARERIAAWEGSKGDLLAELVGSRADIDGSDQGRSFQAFYDFLLSETRQDELADLLMRLQSVEHLEPDRRLRGSPRLVRGSRTHPTDRPPNLRTVAALPRRSGVAGEPSRARPDPFHRGVGACLSGRSADGRAGGGRARRSNRATTRTTAL